MPRPIICESAAADQRLLASSYQAYAPAQQLGPQNLSQRVVIGAAVVAAACVATVTFLLTQTTNASTEAFAVQGVAAASRAVRTTLRANNRANNQPFDPMGVLEERQSANLKRRVGAGAALGGAFAGAAPAGASDYSDIDLFAEMDLDYGSNTRRTNVEAFKKNSDPFTDLLKGNKGQESKMTDLANTKSTIKVDENDPFASLKASTKAPEPKAPEPVKVEAPKAEESSFSNFFKKADPEPVKEAPKVVEAPKEETSFADFFKKADPEPVKEAPKVAPKVVEAPKEETSFADFFKKADPEPVKEAPKVAAKVVEAPKEDTSFADLFKKADAPKEAPKAPAPEPAPVKAPKFEVPKAAEPPKVEAPKVEEKSFADFFNDEAPKEVAKPKTEGGFSMFSKKAAAPVEAPKAPVNGDKLDQASRLGKGAKFENVGAIKAPPQETSTTTDISKPEDIFADFLKNTEPEKASTSAKTYAELKKIPKVEESADPFAALKGAAPKAPAAAPKVEAPKVEAPKVEDAFASLKSAPKPPAPKVPDVPPVKVPAESGDPFAAFKGAAVDPVVPNVAPKVADIPAVVPKVIPDVTAIPKVPISAADVPHDALSTPGLFTPLNLALGAVAAGAAAIAFLLNRSTPSKRASAKAAIAELIEGTNRGYTVDEDEAAAISAAIKALEAQNPTEKPLASPLIDGKWELLYSESPTVLGKNLKSKPKATFEFVDLDAGTITREQVLTAAFVTYKDTRTVLLDVESGNKAMLMKGNASVVKSMKGLQEEMGGSLRGSIRQASEAGASIEVGGLTTTYLDETWRITRTLDGEISLYRKEGAEDEFTAPAAAPQATYVEDVEAVYTPPPAPSRSSRSSRRSAPVYEEEEAEEAPRRPAFGGFPKFGGSKDADADDDEEESSAPAMPAMPAMPKFSMPSFGPKSDVQDAEFSEVEPEQEEEAEAASAPAFTMPEIPNPFAAFKAPELPKVPKVPDFKGMSESFQADPLAFLKAAAAGEDAPAPPSQEPLPDPTETKETLLNSIEGTRRGLDVTFALTDKIERNIRALEALNPTPAPNSSPLISGKWELLYTTSESILGADKPEPLQPKGPIYQYIDTEALRANNEQTVQPIDALPFKWITSVSANITVESDTKLGVDFQEFGIGPLKIPAPASANAKLVTTYLDETLRISRGSKGNVFVLRIANRAEPQPGVFTEE